MSIEDHYSAVELRGEQWSALREAMERLERGVTGRAGDKVAARIQTLFEDLGADRGLLGLPRPRRLRAPAPAARARPGGRSRLHGPPHHPRPGFGRLPAAVDPARPRRYRLRRAAGRGAALARGPGAGQALFRGARRRPAERAAGALDARLHAGDAARRGPLPLRDGDRAQHRGRADRDPLQPQHPGGRRSPRRDAEVAQHPHRSSPSSSAASARRRMSTSSTPATTAPSSAG